MMTTAITETDADQDAAGPAYWVCWDCGGPCASFKGSVHGWRCHACIDRYLDDGAARWLARARKEQEKLREKISRNLLHDNDSQTPVTANGERRDGGGPAAMCRTDRPGAGRTGEGGGSALCAAPLDGDDQLITREDT